MSKYRFFPGPYFLVFSLNTGEYEPEKKLHIWTLFTQWTFLQFGLVLKYVLWQVYIYRKLLYSKKKKKKWHLHCFHFKNDFIWWILTSKRKLSFGIFFFAFKNYESVCYSILKNIFGSSNLTSGKLHLLKRYKWIRPSTNQYLVE